MLPRCQLSICQKQYALEFMTNTNLSLSLSELLGRIRQPYAQQFSSTAAQPHFHVEPVLRGRDGSAIYDGTMRTPYRCDLLHKQTFESVSVDATERIQMDAVYVDIENTRVHVSGFSWDALTLDIEGMRQDAAEQLMRSWFLQWFDENDSNPANAEGLYGLVHFISDPVQVETVIRFTVDLGSAPVGAMTELIEVLCHHGATRLHFY